MSNQVGGRATISTSALGALRTKQGATLDFGTEKRTGVTDDQGVAGHTTEHRVPSVECTVVQKAGVSVKAINDLTDVDITFETDVGSMHVLRHAWCTGEATLVAGEIKAKFEGISCDEVSA